MRSNVTAMAIGLVLLVVVMTNVGAYELLAQTHGDAKGAFMVAGGNAVLAVLVFFLARQLKPGEEEKMVQEIREMTMAELSADVEGIQCHNLANGKVDKGKQRSGKMARPLMNATQLAISHRHQILIVFLHMSSQDWCTISDHLQAQSVAP